MKKSTCLKMLVMMVLVAVMAAGVGCKKSASNPTTITLLSEAALDGHGVATGTSTLVLYATIGDYYNKNQVRGWVSFDLSGIPDGATIDSAVLSIYQRGEEYWGGYTLGPVLVEHVFFGTDIALAFAGGLLSKVAGMLATEFSAGFKSITVTVEVQNDMEQNRPKAQFRFFHSTPTDNDSNNTTDDWVMGDSPTNQPKLAVTYH